MTHVRLRPMVAADSDMVRTWRNLPDVRRNMYTDHEIPAHEHQRWFEATLAASDRAYWIIGCDGVDVGVANIVDISLRHQRCSWAFYLGPADLRGKGIGRGVEYLVQRHVFETLGLNRLCCEVLDFNTAVIEMHQKLGFAREGILREHIRKADRACDVHVFGMLRADWLRLRESFASALAERGMTVEHETVGG